MPKNPVRIMTPRAEIAPATLLIGDIVAKALAYGEHLDFLLSVRDARFATMFEFFLDWAWWAIAGGAAIWLYYELKRRKANPNSPGSVGALIFSSASVAFILGVMIAVSATGSLPSVLAKYGTDPNNGICVSTVDTSRLGGFKDDYRIVLICGVHDPATDPQEDPRICVSSLFHINGQLIDVTAPFGRLFDVLKDKPSPPPGQAYAVQVWHTIALLPKDTDTKNITRVSDVLKQGGRIITEPVGGYGNTTPLMLPSPGVTPLQPKQQ